MTFVPAVIIAVCGDFSLLGFLLTWWVIWAFSD